MFVQYSPGQRPGSASGAICISCISAGALPRAVINRPFRAFPESFRSTDYQLSIINYQLSIINYQLSIINYQLSIISRSKTFCKSPERACLYSTVRGNAPGRLRGLYAFFLYFGRGFTPTNKSPFQGFPRKFSIY